MTKRFIIFVPLAILSEAEIDAAGLDPDSGGAQTFSVDCGTHFGCSVRVAPDVAEVINGPLRMKYPSALVYDCDALGWDDETAWSNALARAGVTPVNSEG